MKIVIDVNKDTSKLLTELIDKMNSTKMSDLDKSRNSLKSMINDLNSKLADTPEKVELIEFLSECIDDDEDLVTIDKDPNIIDNKTLININTRKMNKKDLIKQELGEIETILKNKAYSQLLAKYQNRLFSEVEGLEGEDIQEIKDRLDSISDQLEEISNSEAISDESVEVTDEVAEESTETAEPAETEATEETEEMPEETAEETTEETTEEIKTNSDETAESEEVTEEVTEEPAEEVTEETTEETTDKSEIEEYLSKVDEALEDLKEAVETKDFSKVIARYHTHLFSVIEDHQDLIENIDEVKSAMDDLAEKIEKLDAEVDEDKSDKKEGEDAEVADAEKAEEASDDAHEEVEEAHDEVKTESEDCWVLVKDGVETGTKGTKEEIKAQLDEFGPADRPHYEMKQCSDEAETVTEEVVEETPEVEVSPEQEVKDVAEQAAEEAVEEYMENGLFMNEIPEDIPTESTEEAIISEEVPEKESEVEPMYIDEKTDMVLDPMETEDFTASVDDLDNMEDEELFLDEADEASYCNKSFSRSERQFAGEFNQDKYEIASFEELLGA